MPQRRYAHRPQPLNGLPAPPDDVFASSFDHRLIELLRYSAVPWPDQERHS